jgi:hypothetical protein
MIDVEWSVSMYVVDNNTILCHVFNCDACFNNPFMCAECSWDKANHYEPITIPKRRSKDGET